MASMDGTCTEYSMIRDPARTDRIVRSSVEQFIPAALSVLASDSFAATAIGS